MVQKMLKTLTGQNIDRASREQGLWQVQMILKHLKANRTIAPKNWSAKAMDH